ncbi:MAG: HAD family hydrolase [Kiritimatiellia bacterium]
MEEKKPQFALMFELEYLAADARVATFQTLKGILKEREIPFTQAQFSRLCLSSTPAFFMEAVQEAVGARKLSTRKLVEDVGNGVAMHLADGKLSLSANLKKVLVTAKDRGVLLTAITALGEQAQALVAKLGLDTLGVKLLCFEANEKGFPRADLWLKAAKETGVPARNCLSLVTSMQPASPPSPPACAAWPSRTASPPSRTSAAPTRSSTASRTSRRTRALELLPA